MPRPASRVPSKLEKGSFEYNAVRRAFFGWWYNPERQKFVQIHAILKVARKRPKQKRFRMYRRDVAERCQQSVPIKLLWQSTQWSRRCLLLKRRRRLCSDLKSCNLCRTITTAELRRTWGRFGRGFYVTHSSSRASLLTGTKRGKRALLLADVILGKAKIAGWRMGERMRKKSKAPSGYNSVLAAASDVPNEHQAEYVVYDKHAALPAYVVIYSQK